MIYGDMRCPLLELATKHLENFLHTHVRVHPGVVKKMCGSCNVILVQLTYLVRPSEGNIVCQGQPH